MLSAYHPLVVPPSSPQACVRLSRPMLASMIDADQLLMLESEASPISDTYRSAPASWNESIHAHTLPSLRHHPQGLPPGSNNPPLADAVRISISAPFRECLCRATTGRAMS